MKTAKVVLIGGGTGSYTILNDLKNLSVEISAIVNMSDDGGSTGILRDELGVLPPGDVRQCLVALSSKPEIREMFSYRFGKGSLKGHSLGNIILSGLSLRYNNFAKAVSVASDILNIKGRVLPSTLENNTLCLRDGGKIIISQIKIENHKFKNNEVELFYSEPVPTINPEAKTAISEADLIVIAPGNFFISILPVLIIKGMAQEIKKSKAKVLTITNLFSRSSQTPGWSVTDYLNKIEGIIGPNRVNFCLYNDSLPDKKLLKQYALEDEFPVNFNKEEFKKYPKTKFIGDNLISSKINFQNPNDNLPRTLIRHDGKKVSNQIEKIIPKL